LIARLLAHHHQLGTDWPLSRYDLICIAIERAALAGDLRLMERFKRSYGSAVHGEEIISCRLRSGGARRTRKGSIGAAQSLPHVHFSVFTEIGGMAGHPSHGKFQCDHD
jgi:hypothetical protein